MKAAGIKASSTGLYTWSPGRQAFYSNTGNQLSKAGTTSRPGQHWAGDFTYINTANGYVYNAIVMDLFTRKIIGWSVSRKRNSDLTRRALLMALNQCGPVKGCLFHSDQGIEYAAHDYRELVESAGMIRSMSRKGTPQDNATVESFFHSMKSEVVTKRIYQNEIEAVAEIIEYIHFYNSERLHSSLGYQSPETFERLCA
jgi:putative transposase